MQCNLRDSQTAALRNKLNEARSELSQMQSEISEELFFKLEAIQSGDTTVKISKAEILEHLMQVAKQFHHFALLHR